MKIVIAGGTGTLGRRIAADLDRKGNDIVILARSLRSDLPFRQVSWDGRSVGSWASELEDAVVINLAGELVDRRPTRKNVDLLRRSRVEPTRALVEASQNCMRPPTVWLQGSSTAIYGDAGDRMVTEDFRAPFGPPQMPGVVRPWEEAAKDANTVRQVFLRMSLVFDTRTPLMERLSKIVRLGLGGQISHGRQWVSWVHVQDMLRAVRFVLASDIDGIINVTSPEPVRNEMLMSELRRHLNRPWSPPVPAPIVRIGALLMGSDPALALAGRRCIPARLLEEGFKFKFPEFRPALDDLFSVKER